MHGHARPRSRRISLCSHGARPEQHASNAASWVTRAACVGLSPASMRQVMIKGTAHASLRLVHLLDRAGARFLRRPPRDHGMGRGRLIRRLGPASPPRGSHALGVADGGSGKLGRREQRQWVGPDSLLFPCLDSLSGAAEPPPRSFCPFRLLDLPPEERDRKGITGILSF